MDQADPAPPVCVNPACECDPCHCSRPCTCGVVAVRRSAHEVWDPDRSEYRYIEIQTFKPEVPLPASATLGGADHESHRAHEVGSSPATHDSHGGHDVHGTHGAVAEVATQRIDAAVADFDAASSALAQVQRRAREVAAMGAHAHESTSVRSAEHNGHQIEIVTTYELRINGERLTGHLGVNADGTVHYHGVPNYATESAIDLAKQIVDSFPDDYSRPARPSRPAGQGSTANGSL